MATPHEEIDHRRAIIKSFRAKMDAKRTQSEVFADWITKNSGTMMFFGFHILFFVIWVLINVGFFKNINPFDPYPFNFLTMVVSLEAIFLSIIVLLSQNRAARITDIREEVDMHVNTITEKEITKVLKLVTILLEKNGVDLKGDPELRKMVKDVSTDELEKALEKEIQ